MKLKFLSLIVAGLAFTACSQDDDFVINKAEQGDFSPITFTVDYGDETRMEWGKDKDGNDILKFKDDDDISFFNGLTLDNDGDDYSGAIKVGAHAPFTYTASEDGTYSFKSKNADILQGLGVLVYPADLAQAWLNTNIDELTNSLRISIKPDQTTENKDYYTQIPYASDLFTISEFDKYAPDNSAGVNRNYNIPFKKVGTLINLTLEPNAEQFAGFKAVKEDFAITGITLTSGRNYSTGAFAKTVALGAEVNTSRTAYVKSKWNNKTDKKHMTYGLELYGLGNASKYATTTIKTDVVDNKLARIVLLPNLNTGNNTFAGGSITVHTTAGDIKIPSSSTATPIIKDPDNKYTIDAAFNEWATIWKAFGTNEPKQGGEADRTFTFDLTDLSLNLDVKDSDELIALVKMFDALEKTGPLRPNIKLDEGQEEFVLEDDALKTITKFLEKEKPLEINANGKTIVLKDGDSDKFAQFAEIKFSNSNTNLKLEGNWALKTDAGFNYVATITNNGKLTLTSAGVTVFADGKEFFNMGELAIPNGVVYMDNIISGNSTKDGIITIDDGASCYFAKGTLYGKVTIGKNATLKSSEDVTNYAAISNNGRVLGNDGTFVNEGVITNMVNGAEVAVTSNASSSAQGFIELAGLSDRVTITNASGYVTYVLKNAAEVTADKVPSVANHLTIENASIKVVDITNMPAGIKYLALNGKINQLTNTNEAGLSFVDVFSNVAAIVYPVANKPMTISRKLWVQGTFTGYNGNVDVTNFSNGGSPVEYATGNAIKDKNKVSYGGVFFNKTVVVTP